MFCTESKTVKARNYHRCTSCGEGIAPGESYLRWISIDDSVMTNKMRPECYSAHNEDAHGAQWEYTPYSYPRGSIDA